MKPSLKHLDRRFEFSNYLLLILTIFSCTFFIYRDLGIRMVAGYIVLGLILVLHLLRRMLQNDPLRMDSIKWAMVVLNIVICIQFIRPNSSHDADTASFVISMLVCTAAVLMAAPEVKEVHRALKTVLIASVLLSAYVFFFQIFPDLFWNTVYLILSPTAQNYLTCYIPKGYGFSLGGCSYTNYMLFFGMAVCCSYLVQDFWSGIRRNSLIGTGLVFFAAIVIVGRRGELLGAFVCCALLVLAQCTRRQRRILIGGGAVFLVTGFALMILCLPLLREIGFLQRYVFTIEKMLSGGDFASGRGVLFGIAIGGFLAHPVFGIGWDQYVTLVPSHLTTSEGAVIADAHNIYLQLLCESGIVGTVLVLLPMLYVFWQTLCQLKRLKRQTLIPVARTLNSLSFMLQAFLLMVGMFDPAFQKVFFWCYYGVAVMCLVTAIRFEGHTPRDRLSRLFCSVMAPAEKLFQKLWDKAIVCVKVKDDPEQ